MPPTGVAADHDRPAGSPEGGAADGALDDGEAGGGDDGAAGADDPGAGVEAPDDEPALDVDAAGVAGGAGAAHPAAARTAMAMAAPGAESRRAWRRAADVRSGRGCLAVVIVAPVLVCGTPRAREWTTAPALV